MTDIRRPALSRRLLLFAAAFLAISAAMVARADAETICVNKSDAACTTTLASGQLQTALNQAATQPGVDTILVGPGTETDPNAGFDYNNQSANNEVHIIGSGSDQTTLTWTDTTGYTDGLYFSASPGSTVSELKILIPANDSSQGDRALVLGNDVDANDIAVSGPSADNAFGVYTSGGDVSNSTVDLPQGNDGNIGIDQSNNPNAVVNSFVHARTAVRHSSSGGATTVTGSHLSGLFGASADNGDLVIKDSLVTPEGGTGATGVGIFNDNNGNEVITATLDGVTIVGDGVSSSTNGIKAQANATAETADLDVRNTVITGTTDPLRLIADASRTVTADVDYSAFDKAAVVPSPGTGTINYTGGPHNIDLTGDPQFKNPVGGDFTPTAASPLVDAGDPADPAPGATDILGNARACHGTASGLIRRDIGAFEFKTNPADDCTYPETTIDPKWGGQAGSNYVEIPIVSSKPNSTFKCSIDNGAYKPCTSPYKSTGLHDDTYKLSAVAVDAFGNTDQTPSSVTFTLYDGTGEPCSTDCPPTCTTDKSLCPPKGDITPPKVLKLKAPKKTKKKRVKVSFKSNEKKVIFTCKLNKKKAKRCKSPWKTTKLKKGKNIVRVWAADASGNKSGIKKRVIRRK